MFSNFNSVISAELRRVCSDVLSLQFAKGWKPVDLGPNSFIEIASFLSRCKVIPSSV